MGFFSPALEVGDWVRTTDRVHVTLTDALLGARGGLPAGTRGVVLARSGSRVQVELDAGFGTTRAWMAARHCRLARRDGGVERFRRRSSTITWARIGVAFVFVWPFLWYTVQYVLAYHSTQGLAGGLAVGFVDGLVSFLFGALSHPLQTLAYCVVLAVLSRFAFGRRG